MADQKFKSRVKAQAGIQLPAESTSRALTIDGSGDIKSSSVTTTELGYVSGVTSSIQTQLNTANTGLSDHLSDTTDAHDASAISNVPSGNLAATDVQGAVNELQSDIDTRALDSAVIKKDGSVAFTASQSMGGFQLTGLAAGSASSHAINKGQFDAALEGLRPKTAVRVATTANITIATALNSGDSIDGITLANGDRVLVKDQTSAEQNGIYVVSATPARSTDFDSLSPIDEINGSLVAVQQGTANAGKVFVQSGVVAVLDTDPINFVFFNSSSSLVGGDGITVSGSNISVDHDGEGLTFVATQLALELDGSTLSKSASGLKVNSITSAEVSNFNEAAQDAVGTIVGTSSNIALTYNDGANTIVGSIVADSILDADINTAAGIALTKLAPLTISRALQTDGSGYVSASSVTGAELGHLSGVTSAIQTQLNGKASTTLNNLGTTSINSNLLPDAASTRSLGSGSLPWQQITTENIIGTNITLFNSIGGTARGIIDATTSRTLSSGDVSELTIWAPNLTATDIGIQAGDPASGPTGNVFITTGNASINNNSGNIKLYTGTVSGTGVRGTINLVDASLASASVGHVWTLTNTSTGAGNWATLAGSANTTLSNLTSPTAINQDLIFNKTAPILKSGDTTGVDSASLSVLTGSVTTTGSSGNLTLSSGSSVSASGTVLLSSGNTTGVNIPTGAITIRSGNAGSGAASSGAVNITTGTSIGTAVTGALNLSTGISPGLAGSGNISMVSGNVTTSTSGSSGIITIASGTSVAGATGSTGNISIASGNHASATNASGTVSIKTGDQTGTAFSGTGAATTVTTGNITSATATGTSGGTNVLSGNAAGSAATGAVTVRSGNATGTGNSGNVVIQTGSVTSGTRGTINLVDSSLTGASVGYIWSLTNTSTGAGQWTAAAAGYTDEQAQDAIGTILVDSATIDFTYNDGTPSITAIVIDGSITNTKVATGIDAIKIADGSVTNAEFQYLGGVTSDIQTQLNSKASAQAGDIVLTSFAAADNQASPADVTGLAFANGSIRSFKALVSVSLDATSDLFESFELMGVQKGASWDLSQSAVGDDSGVVFSITNAGQIQYTSPSSAGFVSLTIKFRAIVTTV